MSSNIQEDDDLYKPLKACMQVTNEEIDYLRRLNKLESTKQIKLADCENIDVPSTIIDDFLYHGSIVHASNKEILNRFGIQNIITICEYSLNSNITKRFNVLRINALDTISTDLSQFFNKTNEFLHECKSKNERVLVHCQAGVSRSSTIVLAYLLKYCHETVYEAYDYLTERRSYARPNEGFLLQLIRYEKNLRKNRD